MSARQALLFAMTLGCTSEGGSPAAPPDGAAPAPTTTGAPQEGGPAPSPPPPGEPGIVQQSAPVMTIVTSAWDGTTAFSTLSQWGNFGVGALDGFRAELVADGGEIFAVEGDGVPRPVNPDETAVYLVVAPFVADETHELAGPASCQELMGVHLPPLLPSTAGIYAIRISGRFPFAQPRSFLGWEPPYPNAAELVGAGQMVFDLADVNGTIVAFYLPDTADAFCSLGAGCAQAGFHFHFLTHDRTAGGHLLDCTVESATIEIARMSELRVHMGDGSTETLTAR